MKKKLKYLLIATVIVFGMGAIFHLVMSSIIFHQLKLGYGFNNGPIESVSYHPILRPYYILNEVGKKT